LGTSTTTGPGRPLRAMWKAFFIVMARSGILDEEVVLDDGAGDADRVAFLEGIEADGAVGTWPEMITIGIESMYAVAMPVTALVRPGPEVTSATPTSPVARA
jgi:hypothetical protein